MEKQRKDSGIPLSQITLSFIKRGRGKFKVSYHVVNKREYFLMPLVSVSLLILAITRFHTLISGSGEFNIEYLATAVAILGITLNFMRKGYQLPLRKLIFVSVILLNN